MKFLNLNPRGIFENFKCLNAIAIKLVMLLLTPVLFSGCNLGGKKEENKKGAIVIGVSMLSLQSEFVVNVKDAIEARAKELHAKLIITDAQRTAEKQVQQVETFISQKVDAIILNPCEVEASSPAVDKARAAGIPLINVNSETSSKPDAFVGSNDETSGEMAMEYIARSINQKGNIVIIDGYMGQAAQIHRAAGALKVLAKYPNIKVLAEQTAEWDRAKGMTLMENWIQSFGSKINAVFAHNDEMGLGALQALEQSKLKDKVVLVSIDAIADALQAVKDGRLNATIYQDAKGQGNGAVETAIKLVKKEPLDSKEVMIPFQLVTKENVREFLKDKK
jgi:inositol transport system substrate-binding protein